MHWRISIVGVLALFLGVSCNQQPVEPQLDNVGPALSQVVFDSWVETLDLTGIVAPVACVNDGAGEDLLTIGTVDAYFWSRTTPSGNVMTNCLVDYYTDTPLRMVGLTSGDVWNLFRGEDNCNYLGKGPAGLGPDQFQANEWYINQDTGQKLNARFGWSVLRDNDGNVITERYVEEYKCTGEP